MEKIHYQVFFTDEADTLVLINDLVNSGIVNIYLKELPSSLTDDFCTGIQSKVEGGLKLMIDYSPGLMLDLKPTHIVVGNAIIGLSDLRKQFPTLIIGAYAHSLVDCKNWELAGADFLIVDFHKFKANTLQANALIGQEAVRAFYPNKEEYGWVFMSVNTPIFVKGIKDLNEVESLWRDTDLKHIIINDQFEPSLNVQDKIDFLLKLERFL